MKRRCESCTYYDQEDKFCYYYLLPDTELLGLRKSQCKHWQKSLRK